MGSQQLLNFFICKMGEKMSIIIVHELTWNIFRIVAGTLGWVFSPPLGARYQRTFPSMHERGKTDL